MTTMCFLCLTGGGAAFPQATGTSALRLGGLALAARLREGERAGDAQRPSRPPFANQAFSIFLFIHANKEMVKLFFLDWEYSHIIL